MKQINYKSDFDFILRLANCQCEADGSCTHTDIGIPTFDWTARVYTSTKANAVTISHRGGEYVGCVAEDGHIRVVMDGHHLSPGQLNIEFTAELPDGLYPDGSQRVVTKAALPIELVRTAGQCPTVSEVEVMLPFAVVSAYETAQKAGFAGTQDEYYAGLSMLPALSASVSDLAAAKAEVAAALRMHGVDVADGASLHDMADAVAHLQLAVPSQPGVVAHDWNGLPVPDLLNILRNNRRPADYPYSWAVRTADPTVRLRGADAYLCSDGFFTTETGEHTFEGYVAGERWIVYYHRAPHYTVAPTAGALSEICVLNGTPDYAINDADGCSIYGPLRSYSTDMPADDTDTLFQMSSRNLTDVYLRGIRRIAGHSYFDNVISFNISFPDLEEVATNGHIIYAVYARNLALPALTEVNGGTLTRSCSALTALTLPALTEVNGGTLTDSCSALTALTLPALTEVNGGTLTRSCSALTEITAESFPSLRIINGTSDLGLFYDCSALTSLEFPSLTEAYVSRNNNRGYITRDCAAVETVSLPRIERGNICVVCASQRDFHVYLGKGGGDTVLALRASAWWGGDNSIYAHLHVAPGFRSSLTLAYTFAGTTHDELLELINNLADNNGHNTHRIVLGSTLLALLTEDEIALATAKNYTLS